MQEDALYPTLTIRETLMFSARLRLPGKMMSFREKQEHVNSLIKMLSLAKCADTRVGDQKVLPLTPFCVSVKKFLHILYSSTFLVKVAKFGKTRLSTRWADCISVLRAHLTRDMAHSKT